MSTITRTNCTAVRDDPYETLTYLERALQIRMRGSGVARTRNKHVVSCFVQKIAARGILPTHRVYRVSRVVNPYNTGGCFVYSWQ